MLKRPSISFSADVDNFEASSSPNSHFTNMSLPRGIRNNNPLNIKINAANDWQGKRSPALNSDPVFEQFTSLEFGVRAGFVLIRNYIKKGVNTIPTIISRWAPPGVDNNHTKNYTDFVIKQTGQTWLNVISLQDHNALKDILAAMIQFENGRAIDRKVIDSTYAKYFQRS